MVTVIIVVIGLLLFIGFFVWLLYAAQHAPFMDDDGNILDEHGNRRSVDISNQRRSNEELKTDEDYKDY